MAFSGRMHNNGTVSLNFTIDRKFNLYRNAKYKKQAKPKFVKTPLYACICN